MSRHRKNYFLTLVLTLMLTCSSVVFAATESSDSPKQISTSPVLKKGDSEKPISTMQDSLSTTPTPPPPAELSADPLIPTRRLPKDASTVGGGIWMGPLSNFGTSENLFFTTIGQSHYIESQIALEWSFELTTNAMFGGSYGVKLLQSLQENYEPYFKVAIGGLFLPSESFGTFINWKRYQLRAGVGADDLFSMGRRLRCEASMAYSGFGLSLMISGNYAF